MNNKFRNHPSLILEQIGAYWGAIILFLLINFDLDEWRELSRDIKKTEDFFGVFIVVGITIAIFLFRTFLSAIRWYKTWITVDETSITISVNTLKQSVNTIGIKNISNVNIERNIFEMVVGTSKVKIDTDSHSTADTTDVKIVLKKDKAEKLRQYLMEGVRGDGDEREWHAANEGDTGNGAETVAGRNTVNGRKTAAEGNTVNGGKVAAGENIVNSVKAVAGENIVNSIEAAAGWNTVNDRKAAARGNTVNGRKVVAGWNIVNGAKAADGKNNANENNSALYDVYYNNRNIILHCIYTAPITGIIITLACIILFAIFFSHQVLDGGFSVKKLTELFAEALSAGFAVVMVFLSALYSLIKDFIKYFGFKAMRINNRIQIEFGLFKRSSYDIPTSRINSIVIKKSVISRILHRCCVDLINVGIGDEQEESTRLLLSVPDKYLGEVIHRILPEFDEFFQIKPEAGYIRQPKKIWWRHGVGACKILITAIFIFVVLHLLFALNSVFYVIYFGCVIAFICFYLLGCYGSYLADRLWLHEKYFAVSSGIFAMTIQFVKYSKVQHMDLIQGPLERCLGLQKGTVYILASVLQSMVNIPAFEMKQIESMVRLFLEDGRKS